MADRALRLRLGLFMGGSLIALAGLVVLFGGSPQLFSNQARYALLFPEAPGISPGTPVRKSGVRIGEVTALDLDPDSGLVRVRVAIDRKYLPRQSEDATITRGLLSGDTAVDFLPKLDGEGKPVPRGEAWPPGSEIPGVPPITPRSLLNPAANALNNAQQQLDKITRTFERFEQTAPKLERAADEAADLFKEVRNFIPELRRTNQKLQNLIGADVGPPGPGEVVPAGFMAARQPDAGEPNLRALIREAQEAIRTVKPALDEFRAAVKRLEPDAAAAIKSARGAFDSVNEVLSPENRKEVSELLKNLNAVAANVIRFAVALNGVLDTADKTLKNIDTQVTQAGLVVADVRAITKPLAARSESLVASVTNSAEELNRLLVDVRTLLAAFAKENGTVQKLISDPTVYRNLDDAASSLARILARSEKIARDLEVFADKVARRPELIGVGGALRPSAGLKDLPSAPSYRPDWPPASSARPFTGPDWPPPPVQGVKP